MNDTERSIRIVVWLVMGLAALVAALLGGGLYWLLHAIFGSL